MANSNAQNNLRNDTMINVTVTEALVFPVLEIETLSPSLSSHSIANSHSSDGEGLSHLFGEQSSDRNRLTAELLGNRTQPATFDFNDWEWNTETGTGHGVMGRRTPRQRTLTLRAIQSQPLAVCDVHSMLRPIPSSIPETLPSLYAPSHTEDDEYDDEDDATEADSIFFCNRHQDHQEAHIRTSGSIPSVSVAGITTPEIGFDAPEAFADFEDLGIIVAALRITAEENLTPTIEEMDNEMLL